MRRRRRSGLTPGALALPFLLAALAYTSPGSAQDRVMGLLTLPELFGDFPCEEYVPEEVALYREPDAARPIAAARVDRPWTGHAAGGCEGLVVNVHRAGADSTEGLPTMEYAYEAPAVVVLEMRESWLRVRLEQGSGWLRVSERDVFHPLEQLLVGSLTYVARTPEGGLTTAPAATSDAVPAELRTDHPVDVLETRAIDGALWLRVAVLSHSPCESVQEPSVVARGWLPAHTPSGEPTVWFYSRGC